MLFSVIQWIIFRPQPALEEAIHEITLNNTKRMNIFFGCLCVSASLRLPGILAVNDAESRKL